MVRMNATKDQLLVAYRGLKMAIGGCWHHNHAGLGAEATMEHPARLSMQATKAIMHPVHV